MMKGIDTGKERIQKICDALRRETMEPARQEALEIVENAHMQASEIIRQAREEVRRLLEGSQQEIEHKQQAFRTSLQLACRQGIEQLKQKIEEEVLFKGLCEVVVQELSRSEVIARMIDRFLQMIEDRGVTGEMTAIVPESSSVREINHLIVKKFLDRLKEKSVVVGPFAGGVEIKLRDQKITFDITDRAVREILAQYIRQDFRELVFQA